MGEQLDIRALDFVAECEENLICPICRCPLIRPQILDECGHCFCQDCIQRTWSAPDETRLSGQCPSCRRPAHVSPSSASVKILNNILDDLLVFCPNRNDGCETVVKRAEAQDHISLYCGYQLDTCLADDCDLKTRRKDLPLGCLHYELSCLRCRQQMQHADLESHQKLTCPERRITCQNCQIELSGSGLDEHVESACTGPKAPCPGVGLGCVEQHDREGLAAHAAVCPFALLSPAFEAQRKRLDEQEVAQKQLAKKLRVFERGFQSVTELVFPRDPLWTPSDPSIHPHVSPSSTDIERTGDMSLPPNDLLPHTFTHSPDGPPEVFEHSSTHTLDAVSGSQSASAIAGATHGPYTSPLHHLLSMHESLRHEITRISSALQELDGRHSMQALNDNLRVRDDMSYLGAQLAGLSRQVHWLTSVQLQTQQQHHRRTTAGPSTVGAAAADMASSTSAGVEAAVNAVNAATSLLRGAGPAGPQPGQIMRRGTSEEGRTKL